jgi:hypothetical protein
MSENARIYLPKPTEMYSPDHERRRNARIEELLKTRLPMDKSAAYGGVPHGAQTGTNTAFAVTSVAAVLPFNTVYSNDITVLSGTNIQLSYTADALMDLMLFVAATAAGAAHITLQILAGASVLETTTRGILADAGEVYELTHIISAIPPSQAITIKANCTKNLTIDMTKSFLWLSLMSGNPKLAQSERV